MPRADRGGTYGRQHQTECAKLWQAIGPDPWCVFCGRYVVVGAPSTNPLQATCEHVAPAAYGGVSVLANYQPACRQCNSSKGKRTIAQWLGSRPAPAWAVPGWVINRPAVRHSQEW